MSPSDFTFGFRVLGSSCEERRLVNHAAAFAGYVACDERAECHQEAYLSAFRFAEDFRNHLAETGSTAGFSGASWSPWLWFDVDRADLGAAQRDAARLALWLDERYCPGDDDLLVFFSGSKGFHLGLPTCLWSPAPSGDFHRVARRFAGSAAEAAAVAIDDGVYDRVRLFRAPNSRHPKTGLHKRRLTLDELVNLSLDAIVVLAKTPAPFDVPTPTGTSDKAAADWQAAAAGVAAESEAKAARRAAGIGATLNRSTLTFICDGAGTGDRHRMLFSAAANLAEFGCPPALAFALLEEAALDSGLPPKEVRRQIECGLAAASAVLPEPTHRGAPGTPGTLSGGSMDKKPPEAAVGDSVGPEGQSCQGAAGTTQSAAPPVTDLQGALARLWEAQKGHPNETVQNCTVTPAVTQPPTPVDQTVHATLPPLPPPLEPLPAGAVGFGELDKPCRCGSKRYVDVAISGGRSRRDCRDCGRFIGWGKWYDEGGPAS